MDYTCESAKATVECRCSAELSRRHLQTADCANSTCIGHFCVKWQEAGSEQYGCAQLVIRLNAGPQMCKDLEKRGIQVSACCCESHCGTVTGNHSASPGEDFSGQGSATPPSTSISSSSLSNVLQLTALAATTAKSTVGTSPRDSDTALMLSLAITCGLMIVLLLAATVVFLLRYFRNGRKTSELKADSIDTEGENHKEASNYATAGMSSGRGVDNHMLPRSLVSQINIQGEPLGVGGYGEVYCGTWSGQKVAVKRFTDEKSFMWEHNVMVNWNLRHPNLIDFYGADIEHDSVMTRYLLVTEYHPHGSLHRYLQDSAFRCDCVAHTPFSCSTSPSAEYDASQSVSPASSQDFNASHLQELMRLVVSMVAGVEHLHSKFRPPPIMSSPLKGYQNSNRQIKPVVAHCDIKSQNILIKKDLTCCLADYGQAVFQHPVTGNVLRPQHLTRRGTVRYLPPEMLRGTCDDSSIASYIYQDLYALGLVLWETAQCCPTPDNPQPVYLPPYYSELSMPNPSIEETKRVVYGRLQRPSIPDCWQGNEFLAVLSSIMMQCWKTEPACRLQSGDISRRLLPFTSHNNEVYPSPIIQPVTESQQLLQHSPRATADRSIPLVSGFTTLSSPRKKHNSTMGTSSDRYQIYGALSTACLGGKYCEPRGMANSCCTDSDMSYGGVKMETSL